jgi:hypothetical protein
VSEYLYLFRGGESSGSPEEMQRRTEKWISWIQNLTQSNRPLRQSGCKPIEPLHPSYWVSPKRNLRLGACLCRLYFAMCLSNQPIRMLPEMVVGVEPLVRLFDPFQFLGLSSERFEDFLSVLLAADQEIAPQLRHQRRDSHAVTIILGPEVE